MTKTSHLPISKRGPKLLLASGLLLLSSTGCHSAFIQTMITNGTRQPIRLFEVDYPSASFGGQNLAPGQVFRYRFKVIGRGAAKLAWTTDSGQDHTSRGPELQEEQEGTLSIVIHPQDAAWESNLHTP